MHAGGFQRAQTLLRPFNLGTPPCPLGRLMPRGSQKLSPRLDYNNNNSSNNNSSNNTGCTL